MRPIYSSSINSIKLVNKRTRLVPLGPSTTDQAPFQANVPQKQAELADNQLCLLTDWELW